MRSTNLISPRMELNQYHLLTKKVLFRLSYRGIRRRQGSNLRVPNGLVIHPLDYAVVCGFPHKESVGGFL